MDFASYLHNPFGFPTQEEQAAQEAYLTHHPRHQIELQELLFSFFGNTRKLAREGLDLQYRKLYDKVIKENLIGLILWGTNDIPLLENELISKYQTPQGKILSLEMKNLCQYLVRDYFKMDTQSACQRVPLFQEFYEKLPKS